MPNRYSAAKTPYNTGRPRTGFGCVSCRLYCILCDYDSQNVPGKGCVRHRQPQIEVAGSNAGGFAGQTFDSLAPAHSPLKGFSLPSNSFRGFPSHSSQLAHGGGVCAMGASVLEIPSGPGGGVETSPRVGSDRSCGVPQSSGRPRTCGGGHAESSENWLRVESSEKSASTARRQTSSARPDCPAGSPGCTSWSRRS